jgi:hypothetical protein
MVRYNNFSTKKGIATNLYLKFFRRILLFPFGNNNPDVVSIYLDFVNPMGAPAGWHSCVQLALVLWNPEDPTSYIYHRMCKD